MQPIIRKLAPTLIVMAFVAWICWPHLHDGDRAAWKDNQETLPNIPRSMLNPEIPPRPDRDPFDKAKESPPTVVAAPQDEANSPEPTEPVVKKTRDLRELLGTLSLGATYVRGEKRMALIGNRLYQQGESLDIDELLDEPCVVKRIAKNKVLIEHGEQAAELTYGGLASRKLPANKAGTRHEHDRDRSERDACNHSDIDGEENHLR